MYSTRMAAKVARIAQPQFQSWIRSRLLKPYKFGYDGRKENTYSYDDLLLMRLIVQLKEKGAKPKAIRVALETMQTLCGGDKGAWKKFWIGVSDGFVVVTRSDTQWQDWNPIAASEGPQKLAVVFFPRLFEELKNELVPRDRFTQIDVDPDVLGGSPTVKGTRISTSAVMSVLECDGDPTEVYPELTREQVAEVCDYERSFLQAA